MTGSASGGPVGPPPGDDDPGRALGSAIARGLRAQVERPVDDGALLAGARRAAVRRRHRMVAAGVVSAVVVVGAPLAVVIERSVRSGHATEAAAATTGSVAVTVPHAAAESVPSAVGPSGPSAVGSPGVAVESPGAAAVGSGAVAVGSGAVAVGSGAVAIPDDALLTSSAAAPVVVARWVRTGDTADAPAPLPVAADVCGVALGATVGEAGGRSVTFAVVGSPEWGFTSTVRVFAADGADTYLDALDRGGCLTSITVRGADRASVGHGPVDGQGRAHWFGAARSGRVVAEIRFVVPRGAAPSSSAIASVLAAAVARVSAAGLITAAAADPSLR